MNVSLSIVILNYNNAALSLNLIKVLNESAKGKTLPSHELIVVDNGSRRSDVEQLEKNLTSGSILLKNKLNLGFGGGHNTAANYASGDYLLFLNNDLELKWDCILSLYSFASKHPNVGALTAKQYNGKGEVAESFNHFNTLRKFLLGSRFKEITQNLPEKKKDYQEAQVVDYIQGSLMFFRAKCFYDIGGFDPSIFLYYEETDICYRLKKNGFASVYLPSAEFVHFHEATTNSNVVAVTKKKEILISYLYVLRKNFGFTRYFIIRNLLLFTYLFKAVIAPKKWPILKMLLTLGSPLSHSLRHNK